MIVSTKGRYALRMLLDLAQQPKGEYVALKDIAARQGISKKYLEQIIPLLGKSGILSTNRGAQGGYRLGRFCPCCLLGRRAKFL
jgi:Rrf2 family protein